jgi:integrase
MPTFDRLTRPNLRSLAPGEKLTEHGIIYEKLPSGDGRFSIQLRIDGQKIHRTIGRESEGATRGDAEAVIERLKTEARQGRLKLPKGRKLEMSFREAADKYITALKQTEGKSIDRKELKFKLHLNPFFGSKPFGGLSTFDIDRYKAERKARGAKPATINQELAILSHLYSRAKAWGWINDRPFELKKYREDEGRTRYLTPKECGKLLDEAKKINEQLYLFVKIGLSTGMRVSEITAMRLSDILFSQKIIYIPLAKAGSREQPMTDELALYLKDYIANHCKPGQEWLFPYKRSKTGHRLNFRKEYRQAVENAGLDPAEVVRHTMRHTAVSLLVQAGVDIPTVMNISGHKTQKMVMRYSHRNGEHIRNAMGELESVLQNSRVKHINEA